MSRRLSGRAAWSVDRMVQDAPPDRRADELGRVVGALAPGAAVTVASWTSNTAGLPVGRAAGRLTVPLAAAAGEPSLPALLANPATPAPRILDGRADPVVLAPGTYRQRWRLPLAHDECRVEPLEPDVETALGHFRQTATIEGRVLTLEREVELRQRWVEAADFAALRQLAVAEHRALKRRLRYECPRP